MPIELANANVAPSPTTREVWALFGATGVTGKLVLARALAQGHRPVLIGRHPSRLAEVAAPHGLETCVADIGNADALRAALKGKTLVLNAAGPFKLTAMPLMQAAISAGVDYLDLNGELEPLENLFSLHGAAKAQGVALVGGAGFGIAAADGLGALARARLGGADWVRFGVAADSAYNSAAVSESTLAVIAGGGFEVQGKQLVRRRLAAQRWTERGSGGKTLAFASAPLAELAAVRRVTGARRIIAGVPMPGSQAIVLSVIAPLLPALLKIPAVRAQMAGVGGHSAGAVTRTEYCSRVWLEAKLGRKRIRVRLETGEGFGAAADIALQAVEETLAQRPEPGAHSPATAFGADFIKRSPNVQVSFDA